MMLTNATEAGPLQLLIGQWQGSGGTDVAPESDGTEVNIYRELLTVNPVRPLSNAEEQRLVAVQYHQVIHRVRDNKQIHDQCGYWIWDAEQQLVMHSFTLPRGMALVAGGQVEQNGDEIIFQVSCSLDDPQWPIAQSAFLLEKAKTLRFSQTLRVCGNELSYEQLTVVDIYGQHFDHGDRNKLFRVY